MTIAFSTSGACQRRGVSTWEMEDEEGLTGRLSSQEHGEGGLPRCAPE